MKPPRNGEKLALECRQLGQTKIPGWLSVTSGGYVGCLLCAGFSIRTCTDHRTLNVIVQNILFLFFVKYSKPSLSSRTYILHSSCSKLKLIDFYFLRVLLFFPVHMSGREREKTQSRNTVSPGASVAISPATASCPFPPLRGASPVFLHYVVPSTSQPPVGEARVPRSTKGKKTKLLCEKHLRTIRRLS